MKTLVPWLTLLILLGFPGLAIAEHQNYPRHGSHSKIYRKHGPPHWAPAHGYRLKRGRMHGYYGYSPYGRSYYHSHNQSYHHQGHHRKHGVQIGGTVVIRF